MGSEGAQTGGSFFVVSNQVPGFCRLTSTGIFAYVCTAKRQDDATPPPPPFLEGVGHGGGGGDGVSQAEAVMRSAVVR